MPNQRVCVCDRELRWQLNSKHGQPQELISFGNWQSLGCGTMFAFFYRIGSVSCDCLQEELFPVCVVHGRLYDKTSEISPYLADLRGGQNRFGVGAEIPDILECAALFLSANWHSLSPPQTCWKLLSIYHVVIDRAFLANDHPQPAGLDCVVGGVDLCCSAWLQPIQHMVQQ